MEFKLNDTLSNTSISVTDDSLKSDNEIIIEVTSDNGESWHSIKNIKDFDDLLNILSEFRDRMEKHFSKKY
jgi:hypothetical protein